MKTMIGILLVMSLLGCLTNFLNYNFQGGMGWGSTCLCCLIMIAQNEFNKQDEEPWEN